MSTLAVLGRPRLGRLTAAGLLSEIGDWLLLIALPLFVLDLTGSAMVTATVFALELLPTVIFGPIAGVLVDRYERWTLMTITACAQAIFLLPLLAVHSTDDLWIVYGVVVVESVLGTIIEPARNAAASVLVPADDLMSINGLLGITSNVARLVGGPLGGLVFGLSGLGGVIIADAGTFLVAALLLTPWPSRRRRGAVTPPTHSTTVNPLPSIFRGLLEGLGVVAGTPMLRRVLGVVSCMALAQGGFVVLFVLFVVRDLGGSAADVGILRGVQAVGAIVGGAVLIRRLDAPRMLVLSLAAFGLLSLLTWNLPLVTTAFGLYVGLFHRGRLPGVGLADCADDLAAEPLRRGLSRTGHEHVLRCLRWCPGAGHAAARSSRDRLRAQHRRAGARCAVRWSRHAVQPVRPSPAREAGSRRRPPRPYPR